MKASITKDWQTPIVIDDAALRQLAEIVQTFTQLNATAAVAVTEKEYTPIWKDEEGISEERLAERAKAEAERLEGQKDVARTAASQIGVVVTLVNGRQLQNLQLDQLAQQCGRGQRCFQRIQIYVNDYRAGQLSVDIGGFGGNAAGYAGYS